MFKYGSFFGLSAVHLMFLQPRDVDRIFKFTNIKPCTITLVHNLYLEVKLLQEIFSPTQTTKGIPHVVMKKDFQDPKVRYLIAGLNNFIAFKQHASLPNTSIENLEALEDLASLDELDSISEPTAEGTSFFSEPTEADDQTPDASDDIFAGLDGLNDLESADLEALDVDLAVETSSYSYNDLITWGQHENPRETFVDNLAAAIRYMSKHKADFTTEEYEAITNQIAHLPYIPVGVQLPETFKQASAPASAETLEILQVIYKQMTRKVEDATFIDFVISRLEALLFSSKDGGKLLFFEPAANFSRGKTVIGSNYCINNLQEQYLKSGNPKVLISNVNVLLNDCDEVLGYTQSTEEQQALTSLFTRLSAWESAPATYPVNSQLDCIQELLEYIGMQAAFDKQEQEVVREVISRMISKGTIKTLLKNPDNLKMVLTLYCCEYKAVTKEMCIALHLYRYAPNQTAFEDLEQLNTCCINLFTAFTRETGICGLYCKFEENFFSTLRNIESPLAEKTKITFEPDSASFRMAKLLRMHLLSLRKRLSRMGVK